MKKLILVLVVSALGSLCFGQDQQETELDSASMVVINSAVAELENWMQTTKTFKTGDNDEAVIGLLEYLFFDDDVKYMYANSNPRIAELEINGFTFGQSCTYDEWINSIQTLDRNKHDVIYRLMEDAFGSGSHMERVIIKSKETGEVVRYIVIYYNNNNLRSISDNTVK